MDLGLGNLITLKRELLEPAQREETRWDSAIAVIGLQVARMFERQCGSRFLGRSTAAVDEFSADRAYWVAQRYPIESITSLAQKDEASLGFVAIDDSTVWNFHGRAGLVEFGAILGPRTSIVRMTYIGGYWYDTSEDETGTLPTGATALPEDIKGAWILQCQDLFQKRDAISQAQIFAKEKDKADTGGVGLLPMIVEALAPYRRMDV